MSTNSIITHQLGVKNASVFVCTPKISVVSWWLVIGRKLGNLLILAKIEFDTAAWPYASHAPRATRRRAAGPKRLRESLRTRPGHARIRGLEVRLPLRIELLGNNTAHHGATASVVFDFL